MGASEFQVEIKAKDAKTAFRTAVEQARFEHGHGGYTGTIAEKNGFIMIDAEREARKLIAGFEANLAAIKATPKNYTTPERQRIRSEAREALKALKSVRGRNAAIVRYYDMDRCDKWGPALCVEVKKGVFAFFGLASC
jgi:hypothetical protein